MDTVPSTAVTTTTQPSSTDLDQPPERDSVPAAVAGACALVAGMTHAVVAPAHFAESWYVGAFFAVLAVAQLGLAVALRWQLPERILAAVVLAHLAVIALYVVSRTRDLPFVPVHEGGHELSHLPVVNGIGNGTPVYPGSRIEPVGVPDLVCLVAELVLVAALTATVSHPVRRRLTDVMALLAVVAVVARIGGVLA